MVTVAGTSSAPNVATHFGVAQTRTAMIVAKTHLDINMEYDDAYSTNPYGTGFTGTKWFQSKFTTTNEAAAYF